MAVRRISLFLAPFALLAVSFETTARADGERATAAEARQYESRESDAPGLQEFSGGVGGLLAAIVAFFSDAVEAIAEFLGISDDPEAPPAADQGRAAPAPLPGSA